MEGGGREGTRERGRKFFGMRGWRKDDKWEIRDVRRGYDYDTSIQDGILTCSLG